VIASSIIRGLIVDMNIISNEEDGMISIPQDLNQASSTIVDGDTYILARFSLYGTIVEDSSNSLEEILGNIPNHLWEENSEQLCVCEVGEWRENKDDPSDFIPVKLKTLFTINFHASPTDW
jgi:hypothetical protein